MHTQLLSLRNIKTIAGFKSALTAYITAVFTLDLRALAALRIATAATLLIDLFIRMSNVRAHYTDQGVLPLEALLKFGWSPYMFSVYNMATGIEFQLILMLINVACICCLLIGYRTKLFTFICWIFLLSIHNRNPLVHQGADDLLRMLLFWGMFLPWGYYYSLDSRQLFNSVNKPVNYLAFAGAVYIFQVMFVYVFSALQKTGPEWTTEYTALYYAFSLDQIALPFSKYLYPYPLLLKVITAVVYYLELIFPLILIIPFYNSRLRVVFFAVILSLHIGIALCLNVGLFPLVATVAMVGLLPGNFIAYVVGLINKFTKDIQSEFSKRFPAPAIKKVYVPREKLIPMAMVILFFTYVVANNEETIGRHSVISQTFNQAGLALRLQQNWGMFAPAVFKDDGWFVLSGKTANGNMIDLARDGAPVTFRKPEYIAGMSTYREDRWRKYHENILFINKSMYRGYYCNYLMNVWNETHDREQSISSLKIYYMKEISQPDYKRIAPTKEELCGCGN